jgi:hypothetical protein
VGRGALPPNGERIIREGQPGERAPVGRRLVRERLQPGAVASSAST